ncbi:MAG: pyridoxal phosphate-dependent aminotransferase [Candidatus Goldiibacteriota bacterium]
MLAKRVELVKPSLTLAIDAKAKQMKKDGIDVIGFGAGEPDFNTPENIKEAGIRAIKENITRYTPAAGTPELKALIAEKFRKDNGLEYAPENVSVNCGAKHSLYNIFQAVIDPGDEVIIFSPYWVSYIEQVRLAGGTPVLVDLDESKNFDIDFDLLESKITGKTKVMIVNSPSNPTGGVLSEETLKKLGETAVKKGILMISDEIYEEILYNGKKHISIASLDPEFKKITLVVNGVSKSYCMTGWRIGYVAGDNTAVIKAINKIQSHSTSNPASMSQAASVEALKSDKAVIKKMVEEFDKRRKYMMERFDKIDGISYVEPEGAFYLYPNFSEIKGREIGGKKIENSMDFAAVMLEQAKVAVVPGVAFGTDFHFRMSYATSMDNIEKGLDRIEEILK